MRNQVYHDHKENMIWAALALYLSGGFALILSLNGVPTLTNKALILVGIILVTIATFVFLIWQSINREIAGNKVDGLIKTVIKILESKPNKLEWRVDKDLNLPMFVVSNMRRGITSERFILNQLLVYGMIVIMFTSLIITISSK